MAALILLLSSTPGAYYPDHPEFLNSVVHFLEFGLLAFLLARALHNRYSFSRVGLVLWTTFVCASFGLLDEAHQFIVPERMFDLLDLAFDTLGALSGSAAYVLMTIFKADGSLKSPAPSGNVDD